MPLYEYVCSSCSAGFEFLAKNAEDFPSGCPSCSSETVTKVLSAFAVGSTSAGKSMLSERAPQCGNCDGRSCPYAN